MWSSLSARSCDRPALEVVALLQVRDESWLRRMPPQLLLGQCARGRAVQCEKGAQETEMSGRLLGRNGDDRQTQSAADDLRNLPHRYPFFTNPMQASTRRRRLHGQAEEVGGIDPVNRRPAVRPVARVARHALLPRDVDEHRDEAVVAATVDGRWEAHHGRPPPRATNETTISSTA